MPSYFDRVREAVKPNYLLEREVSSGGMGIVYLARDVALNRHVAIKILRPESATAEAKARFITEAQILAKLSHPNVVPVHHAGESHGFAFYVMDYMQGDTLQQLLARGRIGKHEALKIGRDLLDALSAVHTLGLIHRDIKPSNIFVRDGTAFLGDFGIAMPSGELRDVAVTSSDRVGTPGYMPPEQAYGAELSKQTDLYAAAMVVYEAYTGRRWSDDLPSQRPNWSGVPWSVRPVLRRALAWEPEDRWRDAREFRQRLWRTRVRKYQIRTALIAVGGIVGIVAAILLAPAPPRLYDLALIPASPNQPLDEGIAELIRANMGFDVLITQPDSLPADLRGGGFDAAAIARVGTRTERDSIFVSLALVGANYEETFEIAGHVDALQDVACRSAFEIWRTVGDEGGFDCLMVGKAVDAVDAYMAGEAAFEVNAFRTALAHYERAINIDPHFAAAILKHTAVHNWMMLGVQPSLYNSAAAFEADAAHLHPRDSLAFAALLAPGEAARLAAYERALERYPQDEFLAFLYADAMFHRGPLLGFPLERGAELFVKVTEINPDFAPVWHHLSWAWTALGDSAKALQAVETYDRLATNPSELGNLNRLAWTAYRERFEPDRALEERGALQQDPEFVIRLDSAFRLAPAFDLVELQADLPTLLRGFFDAMGEPDPAKLGHLAVAEGLAAIALGQVTRGFDRFDEAAALFDDREALLQNAAWRLLAPVLGLTVSPQLAERAAGTLAQRDDVRARWALGLYAAVRRDSTALGRELAYLRERAPADTAAERLAGLLEAEALAVRSDPARALEISAPLLAYDSAGRGGDPFARAVLHLERARWFRELGQHDAADSSLRWYRHSDVVRFPVAHALAGEIDWAVGTAAEFKLAERAFAKRDYEQACSMMRRVRRLWSNADETFADRVARADSVIGQACR